MKLENVLIEKIFVKDNFNVREDFGDKENEDLRESLKLTKGNVQPLIVAKSEDDTYQLISGERRLRNLKEVDFKEASCIVYENLSELEKTKLMLHENIGRKNLTWKEEVKALKKLKDLGEIMSSKNIAQKNSVHEKKALRMIKALEAVEEFPELENEKTRNDVLKKYKKLKNLSDDKQESVKNEDLQIDSVLKEDKIISSVDSSNLVIEELKEEINYYKLNPYEVAKQMDVLKRFEQGVIIKEDLKEFIKHTRYCESFGQFTETDQTCIECAKDSINANLSCKLYKKYFE